MSMRKGFTLLETLVAVTILALAVSGPLYVANRAYVAVQISRDQLTASYLAQEGIEYVRSMRDREFLYEFNKGSATASEDAWTAFVDNTEGVGVNEATMKHCTGNNKACYLDPSLPMGFGGGRSLTICGGSCNDPLYLTPSGRYVQSSSGNTQTPFKRSLVGIYDAASPNVMRIESTVTWTNRGTDYSVTVTDNLTPWQ